MARPTKYTKELTIKLCERLAGGMSLRRVCSMDDMPSIDTIRRWLFEDDKPEFQAQYARAREEQADFYADEIIERADMAIDKDSAAAAKVQVDARKWVASKLRPKRYGDKLDIDQKNSGTVTIKIERFTSGDKSTPQI